MEAGSGASSKTVSSESERHILRRRISQERVYYERKQIYDLATEVCQWLSQILNVEITPENYTDKLGTGVELCRLQNILVEGGEEAKVSYNANAKKNSMHARDNITHFIWWCKGFIDSEDVLESNDLFDHKREPKCQMRVLSCLEKVKQKYSRVHVTTKETQMTQIPNLIPEPEGNDKEEEKLTVTSSTPKKPASDNNNIELNPSSTKPVTEPASNSDDEESNPIASNEVPKEEESEEKKERKTVDSSAPAHASNDDTESNPSSTSIEGPKEESEKEKERETNSAISNSEVRYRGNEQSPGESSQNKVKETSGDHNPSQNGSDTACSYFYPLLFLCLISVILLGGLYFFMK